MEEKEIWKDIKGYEDYYQVSNLGRIKSLPRLVWNGKKMFMLQERIKKHNIDKQGYHLIILHREGKIKSFLIHRIVFEAFNGEIPDGMQINHLDECKDNNALSNLNLMTPKENANWGTRNERCHKKQRKQVLMDNKKEFCSLHEAANYLGCSVANVWECCRKPTHTIYGHHFRYK